MYLTKRYGLSVVVSLIVSGVIFGGAYGVYVFVFKDLPQVTELTERSQPTTTRIKDRHGDVLYRIYEDENRTLIPLRSIPPYVVQATIAIEDQSFYSHQGFSVKGIARAFIANLEGKSVQGGSTITQQLVKNRLLSPERTLQRKVRELLLSVMVDASYSKDQILEMYFNQVAYGGSTYGIEAAAQMYFGKPARDLTLAEGTMLAGLPAAPSVYSPFGPHPELAYARQEEVLRRMVVEQFITQEQADAAKQEVLQFRANRTDIKAPHFVMYVKQLLAEKFGENVVAQGGLEVTTTLDLPFHDQVQKLVTDEVIDLARLRVSNGAAVVTRPETGEILAMVGSKDYFDFVHDGQVNVALRPRQPGSSIKPLTYAVAMERGRTPYSVIADAPISYHQPGAKPYAPKNYDGKFHGNVTLKQALASSYNIPAVKLLAEVGINTVIDKGTAMGISTWADRSRFGLSLTLGGGEVLMTDMMELYGTFANNGYTVDLNPILEVRDKNGTTLYRNTCALDKTGCERRKNLDERVAFQITQMLSDNAARTPAFGPRSVLHIPGQQVAVKTGTTNNLRDNWTFGYTSDILVGVWVGNNNNTSMSYVASGVTGASPIWNKIIRLTLDDAAPHIFATPEGLVTVKICAQTGTLVCTGCPTVVEASFVPGTEPKTACNPAQFRPKPKEPKPGEGVNAGEDPNRDKILDGFSVGE
jgi:1A family penicillin-binding protein